MTFFGGDNEKLQTFVKVAESSTIAEKFTFYNINNKDCAIELGASTKAVQQII